MSFAEQPVPPRVEDSLLNCQILTSHADQPLKAALNVTTRQKATRCGDRPAGSAHHGDPHRRPISQIQALVDGAPAGLIEVALQGHNESVPKPRRPRRRFSTDARDLAAGPAVAAAGRAANALSCRRSLDLG
jgi:hypothetical protein